MERRISKDRVDLSGKGPKKKKTKDTLIILLFSSYYLFDTMFFTPSLSCETPFSCVGSELVEWEIQSDEGVKATQDAEEVHFLGNIEDAVSCCQGVRVKERKRKRV